MSFVRPEIARMLARWREVLAGLCALAVGLWLAGLGGPVMVTLGCIVIAAALTLTVIAWRRARFHLDIAAPGVVEVDEGRISYLGPVMGGSVDLRDLVQIEVLEIAGGRRCWRLTQSDGQALLVPLAAAGADGLYDQFAILPGARQSNLLSALDAPAPQPRTVWRRPESVRAISPH